MVRLLDFADRLRCWLSKHDIRPDELTVTLDFGPDWHEASKAEAVNVLIHNGIDYHKQRIVCEREPAAR
jgi:hypothetical protein